jgi:hypothetical protein
MEQRLKSFEESLLQGVEGEKQAALELAKIGVSIMPLFQFGMGKEAPFVLTEERKHIAPDLMCYKDRKAFFVEVKTKMQWVKVLWCEKTKKKVYETGINKRHFDEYLEIKKITGIPVFLCFKHEEESPTGFYFVEISTPSRHWNGFSPAGSYVMPAMVFYKMEDLLSIEGLKRKLFSQNSPCLGFWNH